MELYGQHSKSIPQKVTQDGGTWVENTLHIHNSTEFSERRIIIFTFSIITFFRFAFMMTVLLKRAIPWEESFSVPFAFALYFVGFSLFALSTSKPVDFIDIFGIALFVVGSVLNTGGEILRNQWKKNPDNKGKIYTEGFFKYSRHINYFGDMLWVTAYAIITRNWFAVTIPIFLFCLFAFYNAPKLDKYLKDKYGKSYDDYANKTKMLIPFIY